MNCITKLEPNPPSFEVDESFNTIQPQLRVWHAMPENWKNMTLEVDEAFDVQDYAKFKPYPVAKTTVPWKQATFDRSRLAEYDFQPRTSTQPPPALHSRDIKRQRRPKRQRRAAAGSQQGAVQIPTERGCHDQNLIRHETSDYESLEIPQALKEAHKKLLGLKTRPTKRRKEVSESLTVDTAAGDLLVLAPRPVRPWQQDQIRSLLRLYSDLGASSAQIEAN